MSLSVFEGINYLQKFDDIYVIKTAMPFPLQESNCLLAEADNGWCVIDTGVNIYQNKKIWQNTLHHLGISFKHIKTIIITHYHHDHMGLAGWMQEISGAEVLLPPEDIITFNTFIAGNYLENVRQDCLKAGWPENLVQELAADVNSIDKLIRPFPELSELKNDRRFIFGGASFTTHTLPGHTDGHVVFHSREENLLLSGDNIVPHTILHLTDWPHTRLNNPLNIHLAGLNNLAGLPAERIIPGHGGVFNNLAERISIISKHHKRRKETVYEGLKNKYTAWELTERLFKESSYIHIKRLLLAETLAYLEALHKEGLVSKEPDEKGYKYERIYKDLNIKFVNKIGLANTH